MNTSAPQHNVLHCFAIYKLPAISEHQTQIAASVLRWCQTQPGRSAQYNEQRTHYSRRLIVMLMLHQGMAVTNVARILCAARSSVGRWINWFTLHGAEGLKSLRPGRAPRWLIVDILHVLPLLVQRPPKDFGWLRSRWSTELLARIINQIFNLRLHSATLHRYLKRAGIVWRRAAPTLKIRDLQYEEKQLMA